MPFEKYSGLGARAIIGLGLGWDQRRDPQKTNQMLNMLSCSWVWRGVLAQCVALNEESCHDS